MKDTDNHTTPSIPILKMEDIQEEANKKLSSFKNDLNAYYKDLNAIQTANEDFIALQSSKAVPFSQQKSKLIDLHCQKEQKALLDLIGNLKPSNVDQYEQIKLDFLNCEKKYNI